MPAMPGHIECDWEGLEDRRVSLHEIWETLTEYSQPQFRAGTSSPTDATGATQALSQTVCGGGAPEGRVDEWGGDDGRVVEGRVTRGGIQVSRFDRRRDERWHSGDRVDERGET